MYSQDVWFVWWLHFCTWPRWRSSFHRYNASAYLGDRAGISLQSDVNAWSKHYLFRDRPRSGILMIKWTRDLYNQAGFSWVEHVCNIWRTCLLNSYIVLMHIHAVVLVLLFPDTLELYQHCKVLTLNLTLDNTFMWHEIIPTLSFSFFPFWFEGFSAGYVPKHIYIQYATIFFTAFWRKAQKARHQPYTND